MSTDLEHLLAATVRERLDPSAIPPGDLDLVLASGRRIRRRRRGAAVAAGVALSATAVLGALLLVALLWVAVDWALA